MGKDYTYRFFADPGHAWIEVPRGDLIELGIADKVSRYSYVKGDTVYLEEDCDALLFFIAYEERYGSKPKWVEVFEEVTPIRNYRHYGE
jgi:hypothetical protein